MPGYHVRRKLIPFDWIAQGVSQGAARKAASKLSQDEPGTQVEVLDDHRRIALYENGREV